MALVEKIIHFYESITPLQATIALSVIFLYVLYVFLKDMNVPPGPRGLPFLGYWPFLKSDTAHLQLTALSEKYGDVYSFTAAGNLFIHLGSIKAIKEAHITKSDCFENRIPGFNLLSFIFLDSITFINGEPWKILRKFFVSKFKEYGINAVKENAASSVYDAMRAIVEELNTTKNQPIPIGDIVTEKTLLILRRILFNDQGISLDELHEMNNYYSKIMTGLSSRNIILFGPFVRYCMLPLMSSCKGIIYNSECLRKIWLNVINRHKSEHNESHAADLIHCYLKERENRQKKGDPSAQYFTDMVLASSLCQFVTDGVMSIGVFVGNFFIKIVEYPEEQDKIYKEIVDVIGRDRLPTIEDKSKMPYTNAFICEVTRCADFFPIFPSLQCTKDTTLNGYKIPKGSFTLMNMYGAQHNPKDFENPHEFNPSRYLASPGKKKADLPVLFGTEMGVLFFEHLGGETMYFCKACDVYLTCNEELISKRFRSSSGPAILFHKVVNLDYSNPIVKDFVTGRHVVRDVFCKNCAVKVGWYYELSPTGFQEYKEGNTILEKAMIYEKKSDIAI